MKHPSTIRHRGVEHEVERAERIRGKNYWLLTKHASADRVRYQAYEPRSSVHEGALRTIHVLPRRNDSIEQIRILTRLAGQGRVFPQIQDCEQRGDEIWVVTTWIDGESLWRYFLDIQKGDRPPISTYEAVRLFKGLIHELHYFSKQFCHGDIRPENVILCPEPSYHLALIDFGSAWRVVKTVQRHEGDGCTPTYAAPELLRGEPVNFRSDQFSATMLFYEMLTGDTPHGRLGGVVGFLPDGAELPEFQPPSELALNRNGVSPRLWSLIDEIARRGLQIDPADRFPSRSKWLDAISEVFQTMKSESQTFDEPQSWLSRILWNMFFKHK